MKIFFRNVYFFFIAFGIDPLRTFSGIRGIPSYVKDFINLKKQMIHTLKKFPLGIPCPCLDDRFTNSGSAQGHYFHQDLLVARRINLNNPDHHVDIGSRIDGFVAHVAAFRNIEVFDIRPLQNNIQNITFKQADLMLPVREELYDYCDSLSCLHALEHFGLGRYGDPVNYEGYILGLNNLHRLLKKGGKLYFSVPIGPQRIEFNAHRVFSVSHLIECFDGKYRIDQFSFVDDQGDLHENSPLMDDRIQNNYKCIYGCGILEMTKL